MIVIAILTAFILDLIVGDPYTWPHPVKAIGHYIAYFLKVKEKWKINPFIIGVILWFTTVSLTVVITFGVLHIAQLIHPIMYWLVWIYLAYTTLATRSLAFEAKKVYQTLVNGSLDKARRQVGMIVGRETSELSQEEICNATIETVAENTSDGVIGPLICLFVGGPLLAMAYKAINTLDSMVGYKTEKYYKIGFMSAKIDDLVNLIPARMTFMLLLLTTRVLQYDTRQTFKIAWRDRYKHASPNSAFSEAVVAGALGIQLGGAHKYHGEWIVKDTIGEAYRAVVPADIIASTTILYVGSALGTIVFAMIHLIITQFI